MKEKKNFWIVLIAAISLTFLSSMLSQYVLRKEINFILSLTVSMIFGVILTFIILGDLESKKKKIISPKPKK